LRITPLALVLAALGCGDPKAPAGGALVVGVQAQVGLAQATKSYRVRAAVNGNDRVDRLLAASGSTAALPFETRLEEAEGAEVAVTVEAFASQDGSGAPVLTRLARTTVVGGAERLLRVRLEASCSSVAPFGAPACSAPQTCARDRCVDAFVPPEDLEPWRPAWAVDEPDVCKPAGAGAPEVVVGTGQTDYGTLADGETLEAERGPQGGHHLWIAVRLRNLKQAGSTVVLTATQPGTGLTVPPTSFVFTLDPDEGGYCKLHGLRYQLDNGGAPIAEFLGKDLDVTVEVTDVAGARGRATKRVRVATTLR